MYLRFPEHGTARSLAVIVRSLSTLQEGHFGRQLDMA
jgi:hypothetical protein